MTLPRRIAALAVAFVVLLGTAQGARANAFGAIAYSPSTGQYGYWYGACCLTDAEPGALNGCHSCDRLVAVAVENGWAALAVDANGRWGYGWSNSCLATAEAVALSGTGGPGCWAHVICTVASGT